VRGQVPDTTGASVTDEVDVPRGVLAARERLQALDGLPVPEHVEVTRGSDLLAIGEAGRAVRSVTVRVGTSDNTALSPAASASALSTTRRSVFWKSNSTPFARRVTPALGALGALGGWAAAGSA